MDVPHSDVREVKGVGVVLSRDQLYLEGLGDSVQWISQKSKPLAYSTSLLAHLRKEVLGGLDDDALRVTVSHRPLHLVNPRTGLREYLQWVPPDKPVRYLGVHITATLDWGPEYQVVLNKLQPLLRQIKLGKKLGLAWDVFVQAATTKVMGMVTYHTSENPLVMTHYSYMKTLFEAVGPEQVSPHYESLSRSRRGVLFMFGYIGAIVSISRLGGWSHNEWIRGMVFHHEFLITFYLGYIETRHFVFMPGPKFTIFYNTYARYETQQLNSQWADMVEQQQMGHLVHTKQQIEYIRLNNEYDFVKKRAMVNFL